MQFTKAFTAILIILAPVFADAQSTYIPLGSKEYHLMDRLEIKQSKYIHINFSAAKPYSRKNTVQEILLIDSLRNGLISTEDDRFKNYRKYSLSNIDIYNIESLKMNNSEWQPEVPESFNSKRPVLKRFYTTPSNFYEVHTKDFFLAVNPVLNFQAGKESDNDQTLYINSKGITVRGMIANKIGFSSTLTDNQERGPSFFSQRIRQSRAVPGYGFYKSFKNDSTATDYFDARGYITFNAAKFINFQAGYDKNFIGNGYRSLFLSDFGNSNLFLKINTKIWRFNYQNLFMELMPQFRKNGDSLLNRKYAAMHHLSIDLTKWLNVGLFEGVIFGRKNRFDFQYLNPLIFYRHIEGTVGSPDNAIAGLDFKANVLHRFQVYGQLLLDEFLISQVRNNPKSWVNKFGIQLGGKYIDAFGVKNLDLQLELNRVRPFTYSHNDTIANYTHYNQPLAHPLGANFQEVIGIVNYQPLPKWYVKARAIYYYKGLDSAGRNFGGDIFRSYLTRSSDNGYTVGGGEKLTVVNAMLDVSYEFRENLFFEFSVQKRAFKTGDSPSQSSTMFSGGIRLNLAKRSYDF